MAFPRLHYGDWVRYEGVDYQYFETTDYGDIMLRDWRYDWEFVRISYADFDFGTAEFICRENDERFAMMEGL
jgi:hypothetical protein